MLKQGFLPVIHLIFLITNKAVAPYGRTKSGDKIMIIFLFLNFSLHVAASQLPVPRGQPELGGPPGQC